MTHRSNVYSRNGVVAASQPLAVSAGIEILRKGGSASDAAIAMSAVLAVVEPGASQLGGDAFVITHKASDRSNLAFNGSGEAPHSATAEQFHNGIDLHGYRSATVPGLVSTWYAIHEEFGLLSMQELLAPAIDYAENGFPANAGFVRRIARHLEEFPKTEVFATMKIPTNLSVGDLVTQRDLAHTLTLIAEKGRSAFYEGEIARSLVEASNSWFSLQDLASHRTRVIRPLTVQYREHFVHGQPPPSQGMILMEELLINERFDVASMSEADRIHVGVESKKAGFADRNAILADPEFIEVNVEKILSKGNIDKRYAQITMEKAATDIAPVSEGSDTTYFLVADKDGNAVSWIQSVFHGFGSSWVIPGTGIILNNRLTGFSLDPASPNIIEPGKRPAHTLNAFTVVNPDGTLHLVGGTPGANIQVQTNLQLIVNIVDLKMNVQEATEAPRWQHLNSPGQSSLEETGSGVLEIENRVSTAVLHELRAKGHDVKELAAWGHGSSVQLMQVLPNRTYAFGSDPRCEGHASGI